MRSRRAKKGNFIALELINSNREGQAKEAFLIFKGKTLEPQNRRDET